MVSLSLLSTVSCGITAPVYDEETAELLSAAAVRTGRDITVHYKLAPARQAARRERGHGPDRLRPGGGLAARLGKA